MSRLLGFFIVLSLILALPSEANGPTAAGPELVRKADVLRVIGECCRTFAELDSFILATAIEDEVTRIEGKWHVVDSLGHIRVTGYETYPSCIFYMKDYCPDSVFVPTSVGQWQPVDSVYLTPLPIESLEPSDSAELKTMKCKDCGEEMVAGEIWTTLVYYSSPIGHDHDDNCVCRTYTCPNGHSEKICLRRKCPACDWQGKETCWCHDGKKVDKWPDEPSDSAEGR